MLNYLIGGMVSAAYFSATVMGVIALVKDEGRPSFTAVYASTIGSFGFCLLYPVYVLTGHFVDFGIEKDIQWAVVHFISAMGVAMFHYQICRHKK